MRVARDDVPNQLGPALGGICQLAMDGSQTAVLAAIGLSVPWMTTVESPCHERSALLSSASLLVIAHPVWPECDPYVGSMFVGDGGTTG